MAQIPGVPWDQRPDYLALTQRVDPAGIVTNYNPPRPGVSATDVTSFVYGQAIITINNWPEIMYYLHPTPAWAAFRSSPQPQQKVDANGLGMFERFPALGEQARPLLDFPILPDTICSREELWWIDLWRRMDPRIHWADILMRIEIPGRTVGSDRHLGNSTNNLINRQEHRRYNMLSWHSTGTNSMRANQSRTLVLQRVAAAQPPLPPNSTRGITPGLINPLLGDVPWNRVPHPVLRANQGRLRVPQGTQPTAAATATANQGQPNTVQSNPAQANQAQATQGQATLTSNNQGLGNHPRDNRVPQKRPRPSQEHKGRRPKRQDRESNNDAEDDKMGSESDQSQSSEDIPLALVKSRAQESRMQEDATPKSAMEKVKDSGVKKNTKSRRVGRAKEVGRKTGSQQPDNPTESEPDKTAEDSEGGGPTAGQIFYEGDPGFEAAFQASRQRRRQAANARRVHQRPPRQFPLPSSTENAARQRQDSVSSAELLGESGDSALEQPMQLSDAVNAPQVSAPPVHPQNLPTPAPHQRINELTGLPLARRYRRPEALGGYHDGPFRLGRSTARESRVAPSTSVANTEVNNAGAVATNTSFAAQLGLPVAPANRPPRSYYGRAPDGSHYQYTDDSGVPTSVTHPGPSSNTRIGFTPNQLRERRPTAVQPPPPDVNSQPGPQDPTDAGNHNDPTATNRSTQLTGEINRHNNALFGEMARRQEWPRRELGRHSRAVMELMRQDTGPTWATGFLEREMERERRERQGPSSESDDE